MARTEHQKQNMADCSRGYRELPACMDEGCPRGRLLKVACRKDDRYRGGGCNIDLLVGCVSVNRGHFSCALMNTNTDMLELIIWCSFLLTNCSSSNNTINDTTVGSYVVSVPSSLFLLTVDLSHI